MSVYATFCFIAAAAMLITFVNSKIGHMQNTIAITAGSLLLSVIIIIAGKNGFTQLQEIASAQLAGLDFESFLLKGMLGFYYLRVV